MAGGIKARRAGTSFEAEIENTFEPYAEAGIAWLSMMPVPMTPCGVRHPKTRAPLYIPKGKAPFDVYGVWIADGRFIGAEVKSSGPQTSLSIIMPDKKGSGLQYHQLDALKIVAEAGGIARLVWCNGGQYGVLTEEKIVNAYQHAHSAMLIEHDPRRSAQPGAKSIKWQVFDVVDYEVIGGLPCLPWLRHDLVR